MGVERVSLNGRLSERLNAVWTASRLLCVNTIKRFILFDVHMNPSTRHTSQLIQGEGEIKAIASMQLTTPNSPWGCQDGDRHAIIGSDSDLYLVALISRHPNVFIAPDESIPRPVTATSRIPAFSREAVGGVWGRLLGLPQLTSAATTRLGLDVCLLAALASGNDYLPALQVGVKMAGGISLWGSA